MAQGPTANPLYLKPGELDDSSIVSEQILLQRAFNPAKDKLRVELDSDIQIGAIEIKDWDSDLRADVVVRDDGVHALAVDVHSDIQIGAIEIKDWDSETRVDVEVIGNYNAMLVRDAYDLQKSTVNIYGDANISYDTEATVCSYTVPIGKTFKLSGVIIGGNADGEFSIEVGATRVAFVRNSAASRTDVLHFWNEISVNSGGVVNVKVKNRSIVKQNTRQFEATINGHNIPA